MSSILDRDLDTLVQAADALHESARIAKHTDATLVAVLVTGLVVSLRKRTVQRADVITWTIRVTAWSGR